MGAMARSPGKSSLVCVRGTTHLRRHSVGAPLSLRRECAPIRRQLSLDQ